MNQNQINTEILEALGVPMKNVCGAYLVLTAGEYPTLTVQTLLSDQAVIDGALTKFSKYRLTPKEADDGR